MIQDQDLTIQFEQRSTSGTTMKKTKNTRNFNKIFQKIDLMIRNNFQKYNLQPEQFNPVKIEGKAWIV